MDKNLISKLFAKAGSFVKKPVSAPPPFVKAASSFEEAEAIPFRRFLGGELREGAFAFVWRDAGNLNVMALMEDSDPFSDAAPKQDRTWEKGDVMELFIQPPGVPEYYELHATPSGATLSLRIPSIEEFRATIGKGFKLHLFETGVPRLASLVDSPFKGWAGFISVPLDGKILGKSVSGARLSVCRYNYNHAWGAEPELSSISEFDKSSPTYHTPGKWLELREA